MKTLLIIAFLFFSCVHSVGQKQKQHLGFGSLTVQLPISSAGRDIGFAINMGVRPVKEFGLGVGIEAFGIKESKTVSSSYLPIYADIRYFFINSKVIEPFFAIQPGYGLYNYAEIVGRSTIKGSGGVYFGSGLGVRGKGKLTPIIMVRYTTYSVGYTVSGDQYYSPSAKGKINGVTVNFGISF